jgi:DNA polymerase-3 subunit epsilon
MGKSRVGVFDEPLVFVDIETNGLNHIRGRVIEVGVLRVEHGQVVSTYNTLINPETNLPQFITTLTGISANDFATAPNFADISADLHDVLDGAIFVAHNVRFDYSFLKQEFSRVGLTFLPKQLCTVKLSRALYPDQKGHKLADLIRRHNFSFTNRHRAYDDAAVLWQFVQHIQDTFTDEQISRAIGRQLQQPAIPKSIEPDLLKNLPETPGVYIFEDELGRPLYVGKSINIKKRVLSHFGRDHAESKEFKIAQSITHIETRQTPGELAALLLESELIKEMQPVYNRRLRKVDGLLLAKQTINPAGYLTVSVEAAKQVDPDQTADILAIYPRRSRARAAMNDLLKTFDLCPKLLGLEKAAGSCFLYQLHKCRGACIGAEPAGSYNQRLLTAFERQRVRAWPYEGAVLLSEKYESDSSHALIIDQWCVLGEVTQEAFCEPVIRTQSRLFDLDTYKILQSFISSKLDKLIIQTLSGEQLRNLTMYQHLQ